MRTMKTNLTIPGKRADSGRWRLSGLARPPSDGRIPSAWRGDEIGKHSGLKIRRLTACRFKSGPRYQRQIDQASLNEWDGFLPGEDQRDDHCIFIQKRISAVARLPGFHLAWLKGNERSADRAWQTRFIDAETASHPVFA